MSKEELQAHINKEFCEKIRDLEKHADVANREMGLLQTDYAVIREKILAIEDKVRSIDARQWWILSTVVGGTVIQILLKL